MCHSGNASNTSKIKNSFKIKITTFWIPDAIKVYLCVKFFMLYLPICWQCCKNWSFIIIMIIIKAAVLCSHLA